MKRLLISALALMASAVYAQYPPTPDQLYGQLFSEVQLQRVFPDGKTFVDCTPKRKVADIMYDYGMMKGPGFDLKKFVADNFNLPPAPPALQYVQGEKDASMHIRNLWNTLRREADVSPRWEGKSGNGHSLLALPYPYVVPGGRFREIYYWDSYFTMLGLRASGRADLIESMVKNFDYLIQRFGHIPNGNRTYYLSRSQPPFFCLMVDLLAGIKGNGVYKKYLSSMEAEYAYWMEGAAGLKPGMAAHRVVRMPGGELMNRYWDESDQPRQESYRQDVETGEEAANELAMRIKVASPEKLQQILDKQRADTYRELRAGACSGWDFSCRWFSDTAKLSTIGVTGMVPVDLNSLMYSMENIIARAAAFTGKSKTASAFNQLAARRKAALLKYCWSAEKKYFMDYRFADNSQSEVINAAGMYPLFLRMATPAQAAACAATLKTVLLQEGGITSTPHFTGQQWDAPNGWAPLQWTAIMGLENYGYRILAADIARRWVSLNTAVYERTGKMMEKYNVVDTHLEAGGGEYPGQDGFGWTNGVYLALKARYKL